MVMFGCVVFHLFCADERLLCFTNKRICTEIVLFSFKIDGLNAIKKQHFAL